MNRSIYKVKRLLRLLKEQGGAGLLFRLKRRFFGATVVELPAESVELTPDELQKVRDDLDSLGDDAPLISVLLPVYNVPVSYLRAALDSVCQQIYQKWELCVADDASTDPQIRQLLEEYENKDARIRVTFHEENGHIAKASNSALKLARGDYVALLDHDDLLPSHALACVALFLSDNKGSDVLYTDEAKVDESGNVLEVARKPPWSPQYFYSYMYTGHLAIYSRELVLRSGGFRVGFEGSQDYDLMLRVLKEGAAVKHLPKVLYCWRSFSDSVAEDRYSKVYAYEHALRSLREHLPVLEPKFREVEEGIYPGVYRTRYVVPEGYSVARVELSYDMNIAELLALEVVSDALFFSTSKLSEQNRSSLSYMLEALQASGVEAVTPLILREKDGKIESAGCQKEDDKLVPFFSGRSPYEGGEGMRIATGGEVPAATLTGLLVSKEFWCEFVESTGREARNLMELEGFFADYMLQSKKHVYYCSRAVFALK